MGNYTLYLGLSNLNTTISISPPIRLIDGWGEGAFDGGIKIYGDGDFDNYNFLNFLLLFVGYCVGSMEMVGTRIGEIYFLFITYSELMFLLLLFSSPLARIAFSK